jgi:hypothetical protein
MGLIGLAGCPASSPKTEPNKTPSMSQTASAKLSTGAPSDLTTPSPGASAERQTTTTKGVKPSHLAVDFAQRLDFPSVEPASPAGRPENEPARLGGAGLRSEAAQPLKAESDAKAEPMMTLSGQSANQARVPVASRRIDAEERGTGHPLRGGVLDEGLRSPERPVLTSASAERPTRAETVAAVSEGQSGAAPKATTEGPQDSLARPNPLRKGAVPPLAEPALPNPLLAGESASVNTTNAPAAVPAAVPEATGEMAHPRTKRHNGEKFDPVKENGTILVDWPKPRLALVITGRQDGYLEPCGCAGLDRMKGGISRRYSLLKMLREQGWPPEKNQGWPVLAVDVGGLSKGFGQQAVQKFHISVDAYRQMGYDAIGLGVSDLQFSSGDLISVTASQGKQASPFVCANVGLGAFDPALLQPYRVVKVGGVRVGITAVLGQTYQKDVRNAELVMASAETKLAEVFPKLQQEADYFLLLAYATIEETTAIVEKFPKFNMVVTAGGGPEPPNVPTEIKGTNALMVQVGEKGMNAIVIGLYDDPDPKKQVRYQRVPLDSRFANAVSIKQLIGMYQETLQAMGFEGLGLRAVPHPKADVLGKFVGSAKCATCHEASYKVWKRSAHSHALATLEKADPPRQFDPECLSCHVVGWHGQGFYPYESGYLSQKSTPHLTDVGCESCHGPGEKHVAAEAGGDVELQKKLQKAMSVTQAEAENHTCRACHDLDNSPDFDFKAYWPLVEHKEK